MRNFLTIFSLVLLIFSCKTPKDVVYFQNSKNGETINVNNNFTTKYRSGDILSIFVSAPETEIAKPFNLGKTPTASSIESSPNNTSSDPEYLVDTEGNIDFPIIGLIKVLNLNRIEVQKLIQKKLKPYINTPTVSVNLKNFKITILGEVSNPGTFSVPNERISIIEALGLAKDLNIKGKRTNITVIRENKTNKSYYKLNLTSKDIFSSPAYFLAQNDVIYVEPNKAQVKSSEDKNWTQVLTSISSVLSIALSIIALSR